MNHTIESQDAFKRRIRAASSRRQTGADIPIAEMRWFPVREPVSGSRYSFLRVKTRSGLTGWGECAQAAEHEAKALEKEWLGRSATMYAAIDRSSPLAGALDMALLDILGKACRAPVYRVLGGPTRHKVRAFTDSNAAAFSAVAIAVAETGIAQPGQSLPEPGAGAGETTPRGSRLRAERAADRSRPGDAASVAAAVESCHPLWFDEPCSVSNARGGPQSLRRDGDTSGVRPRDHRCGRVSGALARGTGRRRAAGYRALGDLAARASIAVLAEAYYVAIAPHHDGGPVATAAALHLAASVPNFFIQHVPLPARSEGSRNARGDRLRRPGDAARRFLATSNRVRVSAFR